MPHLSRKPLPRATYLQIVDELDWLMADIKSETFMKAFLNDFFTKTERIRLAKRLALALMIVKNYEVSIITKVLSISKSTVYIMQQKLNYENRGFKKGLEKLIRNERMEDLWNKINKFIEHNIMKPSIRPRLNP